MKRPALLRLVLPSILLGLGVIVVSWGAYGLGLDEEPLLPELPRSIGGWSGEDMPLENALVAEATSRLLNYDRYLYRRYSKGGREVFIYAMAWRQGRISVREMAGHTPDGCWPMNGAELLGAGATARTTLDGRASKPSEYRHFRFPGGNQVNVWWWQLWGDRVVPRSMARKSIFTLWEEIRFWLVTHRVSRCNHMLVRVHAADSVPAALETEPVREFLRGFAAVWETDLTPADTVEPAARLSSRPK